jgi:hypothetical protein
MVSGTTTQQMRIHSTTEAARAIVCLVALIACSGDAHRRDSSHVTESAGNVVRADSLEYTVVRGLYVNRFAAQSSRKMQKLFAIADSSEINAFVIDMKDEFGLNFNSSNPQFAKYAGGTHGVVHNVRALVDSVKAHGLVPIARIVTFKDPVTAELNPAWTIRREDGSAWTDKQGLLWVNPYNRQLWEYDLGIAEELVHLGFQEIQFDYIRFPEPYQSLPKQVFPGAVGSKADILAAFLKAAHDRLSKLGVRTTADIFGLVTTTRGPLEVGQEWEKLAPVTDVLLPMVYPSHYPHGSFGLDHPNAEPYKVIKPALAAAHARDEKLHIAATEHVRPWLQAFSIGKPEYGPDQLREQKRAAYDAGYHGWVLWNPASSYEAFVPALEGRSARPAVQVMIAARTNEDSVRVAQNSAAPADSVQQRDSVRRVDSARRADTTPVDSIQPPR